MGRNNACTHHITTAYSQLQRNRRRPVGPSSDGQSAASREAPWSTGRACSAAPVSRSRGRAAGCPAARRPAPAADSGGRARPGRRRCSAGADSATRRAAFPPPSSWTAKRAAAGWSRTSRISTSSADRRVLNPPPAPLTPRPPPHVILGTFCGKTGGLYAPTGARRDEIRGFKPLY